MPPLRTQFHTGTSVRGAPFCNVWRDNCAIPIKTSTKKNYDTITITILTQMMADEFNFWGPEIKNYKAEADQDLVPIPGQLELHGRCRCGVLLSPCFCALSIFVADLIVGMEELELHYRCRARSNLQKIKIATISVRMVWTSSRAGSRGGGGGVDLSFCVFPCFAVFGGPKIPRCWKKLHESCHCHSPLCVP